MLPHPFIQGMCIGHLLGAYPALGCREVLDRDHLWRSEMWVCLWKLLPRTVGESLHREGILKGAELGWWTRHELEKGAGGEGDLKCMDQNTQVTQR